MPNIKSQIARLKTNMRDNRINRMRKSQVHTAIKKVDALLNSNASPDEIMKWCRHAESIIDSTARSGTIHRNKASRLKSRLLKKVNKVLNLRKQNNTNAK